MTTIPVPAGGTWQHFLAWFAHSPIASFGRSFLAMLIALALASWQTDGRISFDQWQSWLIAALSAAVPVLLRWLNPNDTAYGLTHHT